MIAHCLVLTALATPLVAPTDSGQEPRRCIREVRTDLLIRRALGSAEPAEAVAMSSFHQGAAYRPAKSAGPLHVDSLSIIVEPEIPESNTWRQKRMREISVPPTSEESAEFTRLGDDRLMWSSDRQGGTIHFRRANVSIRIHWTGPWADLTKVVHAIDDALMHDRDIAPRCDASEMPAIEALDFPARIERSRERDYELGDRPETWPRFTLKLRNVPSLDDVRVLVRSDCGIKNHVMPDGSPQRDFLVPRSERRTRRSPTRPAEPDEDGRFMLNPAHGGRMPEGKQRVSVFVLLPGNVVLSRDVEVEIVPAD